MSRYPDGRLCISILHPPGDDPVSGEKAEERWNPTQTVESILLSIISLLNDPNTSSPANVDAGVAYRNDRENYNKIILTQVERSKKDIPPDLVIPTSSDAYQAKPKEIDNSPDDEEFWYNEESDEGGFPTTSEDELD
jgi:ubiquitin-conjugating enzyme E2 R